MGNTFYFDWEVRLEEWLQGILGSAGGNILGFFTLFGESVFIVAILGFMYWCYDKNMAKRMALAIAIAVVWNPIVKNIFVRRRPYMDNPGIKCLKPVEAGYDIYDISAQGFSFPSGHSTNSLLVFGSLANLFRKRIFFITAAVLTFLVGLSRVVLGVHYPTDVLVGWAMGAGFIFLSEFMLSKVDKKILYPIVFAVSCVGIFFCRTDDYFTALGLMGGIFVSVFFEEKYVNFDSTRSPLQCVIRMIGGGVSYYLISTALKLLFGLMTPDDAQAVSFFFRALRYFIASFVVLGVYPMCFKYFDRIGGKKHTSEESDQKVSGKI